MLKVRILLPIIILGVSTTIFRPNNVDANAVNPECPAPPPSGGNIVEKNDKVTKSSEDKREYRFLKLDNDLKILLVSDPATDVSGGALTVNSGWIDSFKDLPGCSHLLEHMLFMGSGKFKEENDYRKFISEHAGYNNAWTMEEQTTFYFDVSPDALSGAVERLSQFFIDPLMLDSTIEKEAKIVDSELQMKLQNDALRMLQLMQHLSKPDHPNNVFACGNFKTLYEEPKAKGMNIRDKLFELYNTRYSANVMYLAVYGKESLDDLEKLVVPFFKDVKNKKVTPTTFKFPDDHPWGPEQLKKQISIVPIRDTHFVELVFATPDVIDQYPTSPDDYVSYVIGYGGAGGLLSTFKSKDLCGVGGDYYSTVEYNRFAGCGFFKIRFSITEAAMKNTAETINYIAETVFQYIELVKTDGVQKWIFDESLKKNQLSFKFQDQSYPSSYLTSITPYMKYARPEDILSLFYIHENWEPNLITDFLGHLKPDNMNILLQSPLFKDMAKETEPFMGVQYKTDAIASDLIQKWSKVGSNPDLQLPKKNEFLAEKFDMYPIENKDQKVPRIIQQSQLSLFWFMQDIFYNLPKLSVTFEIQTPTVSSATNAENSVLGDMFAILFTDSMEEYTYLAKQGALEWVITCTYSGFRIDVSGFNDKLPTLIEKIMGEIQTFKISENRFANLKEVYIRSLKNFESSSLFRISANLLGNLITEKNWTNDELLKATETALTPANFEKFRAELFSTVFIQGLIYGNANEQVASDLVKMVEKPFSNAKFATAEQIPMLKTIELKEGSNFAYEKLNDIRPNSYYYSYFQVGPGDLRKSTLLKLLVQIMQEPMFNTLRTNEQLCYFTDISYQFDGGILGYITEMESEKHPVFQGYRIQEFLGTMKKTIEDMSDEEFETEKMSVKDTNLMMPKDYIEKAGVLWGEISNRLYVFDRLEKEVEELKTITKAEVLALYETIMSKTSQQRRMTVYVTSQVTKPTIPPETPEDKSTKITDIADFRSKVTFYPYPPPSIEVPAPLGNKKQGPPPAPADKKDCPPPPAENKGSPPPT